MVPRLSGQNCKFFKFLLSLISQKRLEYKENNTKYRSLTRKPRSHVRILIYRTWPIINVMQLSMSIRRGIEQGFDGSLWPGVRAFELSCCPGGRDIWILFMSMTTNHFPGWGISVIFDLTFLPRGREFDSDFLVNVKSQSYAPPPPCRLDIDRCITCVCCCCYYKWDTIITTESRTFFARRTFLACWPDTLRALNKSQKPNQESLPKLHVHEVTHTCSFSWRLK